jgi:hypothetical protein
VREVERISQSHQKPTTKNDFPPKPNHLKNRLDTTPAPPVFPTHTNDLQKSIKFVSTSGKVFFGKESEKASEEKLVEKSSGEKPSEKLQLKPKPKLVRFHATMRPALDPAGNRVPRTKHTFEPEPGHSKHVPLSTPTRFYKPSSPCAPD